MIKYGFEVLTVSELAEQCCNTKLVDPFEHEPEWIPISAEERQKFHSSDFDWDKASKQRKEKKCESPKDKINKLLGEMDSDELSMVLRFCKMIRNAKEITIAKTTALVIEAKKYKEETK